MKKHSILFALFLMLLVATNVVVAESKPSKPRASEVVLVARFQVTPPLDMNFFKQYQKFKSPGLSLDITNPSKGETDYISRVVLDYQKSTDKYPSQIEFGVFGKICFAKLAIPKNREIILNYARVFILNNPLMFFNLPLQRKIVIPENVNYVYLGTFVYELENEYFLIKGMSRLDEYDEAKSFIATTYDAKAELVRVNLLNLE